MQNTKLILSIAIAISAGTGCAGLGTQIRTQLDIHPMALQAELAQPIGEAQIQQAQQADQLITKQLAVIDAPQSEARIQEILQTIIPVSHEPKMQPEVRIIDDESLNAFVTGGNFFYVHTGLLQQTDTDSLAGVLAHELAHISAGHIVRTQRRSVWTTLAGLLAGKLTEGTEAQEIVKVVQSLAEPAYSREHEREADILGVLYAHRAGYDPLALAEFFQKTAKQEEQLVQQYQYQMQSSYRRMQQVCSRTSPESADCQNAQQAFHKSRQAADAVSTQTSPLFRSHPMDQERRNLIRAFVDYLEGRASPPEHPTVQKILEVLNQLEIQQPSGVLEKANRAYLNGDIELAEELYLQILKTDPTNAQAAFYLGDLYRHKGLYSAALENYRHGLQYDPRNEIILDKIKEIHQQTLSP